MIEQTFIPSQPPSETPNIYAMVKRLEEVKQEIAEAEQRLAELNEEAT